VVFDEIRHQAKDLEPIPYAARGRSPLPNLGLETLFEIAQCFQTLFIGKKSSEKTRPQLGRGCVRVDSMECHLVRTPFGTAVQRLS